MKVNLQEEQVQTYGQTIGYNAFDDMTSRLTSVWGGDSNGFTASYTNGKKQNSNEIYDASGNIVDKTTSEYIYERSKFDAAGHQLEFKDRYFKMIPQQSTFDRIQTITQSYDGDGNSVKKVDNVASRLVPNPNYTVTEKTEYYVRSTVLGQVLTELDNQGAKKVTNVYTGNAILAEQRNFPADAGHSSAWSEVFWKHQDINTGSYRKIASNGQEILMPDVPSSAEFEPLGGIVPQSAPPPPIEEPENLANYQFGGNVERPESGCAWNNVPINCSHLSFITRGRRSWQIQVNIQAEGGWNVYHTLQSGISVRRYGVIREGDWRINKGNGAIETPEGGEVIPNSPETYIATVYVILISPIWDTLINQTQRQTRKLVALSAEKDTAFRNALSELVERLKQGKLGKNCKEKVLDKLATLKGFNLEKFIQFLGQGGDFYDGEKSTALISDYLITDSPTEPNRTIAQKFDSMPGLEAEVAAKNIKRFTVFFSPDEIETKEKISVISGKSLSGLTTSNQAFAFHEALHGYGVANGIVEHYGDPQLKTLFGITSKGSKAISKYIEDHCFKN